MSEIGRQMLDYWRQNADPNAFYSLPIEYASDLLQLDNLLGRSTPAAPSPQPPGQRPPGPLALPFVAADDESEQQQQTLMTAPVPTQGLSPRPGVNANAAGHQDSWTVGGSVGR